VVRLVLRNVHAETDKYSNLLTTLYIEYFHSIGEIQGQVEIFLLLRPSSSIVHFNRHMLCNAILTESDIHMPGLPAKAIVGSKQHYQLSNHGAQQGYPG
jgi:hypothetical protein